MQGRGQRNYKEAQGTLTGNGNVLDLDQTDDPKWVHFMVCN